MARRKLSAFAIVLASAACEDGGRLTFQRAHETPSPTPTATPGAFQVVGTMPGDNELGVDLSITSSVLFSEAVNASSLSSTSFVVRIGEDAVEGAVSVSSSGAEFVPSTRLRYSGEYEATLTDEVESAGGIGLAAPYVWTFATRDLAWSPAEPLETESGAVNGLAVAAHPDGGACAIWRQSDGTDYNLYAARESPGLGWTSPELVESAAGDVLGNTIAVAAGLGGEIMATWRQPAGNVWASRYTPATGWSVPQLIDSQSGVTYISDRGITLAMDAFGDAITAWAQTDGTRYNIWANRYQIGSGWGAAQLLETDNTGSAYHPYVAVAPNGEAVVAWEQYDGVRNNIMASRYVPGVGWGAPTPVELASGEGSRPAVAMNDNLAITAWAQSDGISYHAYSSVFEESLGWSTPQLLEQLAGNAVDIQVVMTSSGAVACWNQNNAGTVSVVANRYVVGAGWGTATPLGTDVSAGSNCRVTTDATDQSTVTWSRTDGKLARARFLPGSGWGQAEIFENVGLSFDVSSASDGRTYLVWVRSPSDLISARLE